MDLESLRAYCMAKHGVTESLPFDDVTLVFKVMDKMFLLTKLDDFQSFNVKCDPEKAITLREEYHAVMSGYHMNKKHWNTIMVDGSIPDNLIWQWVDDSYDLVVATLTKVKKEALKQKGDNPV